MSLQDYLSRIRPCDMSRPFIFICYSSQDAELVYRDVIEFQRRGYNVWIDEKNVDKTKASWKQSALAAIQDFYCELVVFYVSRTSLVSRACLNEMMTTQDPETIAVHMGPVRFICIDTGCVFGRRLTALVISGGTYRCLAMRKMDY